LYASSRFYVLCAALRRPITASPHEDLLGGVSFHICVLFTISCRDEASEANHGVDERASTYRLLEPVSLASRAEDLDDLRRLQKSSTKPRKGRLRGCILIIFVKLGVDLPKAMSLVTRPTDF